MTIGYRASIQMCCSSFLVVVFVIAKCSIVLAIIACSSLLHMHICLELFWSVTTFRLGLVEMGTLWSGTTWHGRHPFEQLERQSVEQRLGE